jgi:poly-gamma-glutamate synthesis protein (capsule biosynthesis protein)
MGKALGQVLLRDPAYDPFAAAAALFASADVQFVNLESQLSDQRGETQHPQNSMVFVGPPAGADALARAGIDLVSLANNHMWDYGERALLDTFRHLERAGVAYVGAARKRPQAYAPAVVERGGFRLAVLAVTDIWNQGLLWDHAGNDYVAGAEVSALAIAVRKARRKPGIDAVVVSHHGGGEYLERPLPQTRAMARAAIDAGADAFIGHHPHVIQGVEMRRGRPIFYSIGNFIMRMSGERPAAELGMLARLRLRRGAPPAAEVCPVRNEGESAVPLAGDPRRAETEAAFVERLRIVSAYVRSPAALGRFGEDGCAAILPEDAAAR